MLDTVRTGQLPEDSPDRRRVELQALALLRIHLLAGTAVPVLSETQAIDSSVLLDQLTGDEATAFLDLVRDGHLTVRLRSGTRDLRHATIQRLEDGRFIFSAWPELSGDGAEGVERRTLAAAALREGDPDRAGDDATAERIDALLWFDDALRCERMTAPDGGHGAGFASNLEDCVRQMETPGGAITEVAARRPAGRSQAYDLLDRSDADPDEVAVARELVDWAYNLTVAVSLDVEEPVLTSRVEAVAAGQSNRPRSAPFRLGWLERGSSDDPVPVGWTEVAAFLAEHGDLTGDERGRRAEAARFLARARVGRGWELTPKVGHYVELGSLIASELVASLVPGLLVPSGDAAGTLRDTAQLLADRRSRADVERMIDEASFDGTGLHGVVSSRGSDV